MNYPLNILHSQELEVLYKMFNLQKKEDKKRRLELKLSKLLLPAKGLFQKGMDYPEFLNKIAEKNKIKFLKTDSIYKKESTLFVKLFSNNFNNLSETEKKNFLNELQAKGLTKDQVASITALSTIGAAQLSGFGVYLLASSTVGALSSALGVALPFAFYTGMSKVISIAIGPVGLLLAAYPIYRSYKGVNSWDDFKNRSNDHYSLLLKEGGSLVLGNYEHAETVFNYWAGLRIMKIHEKEIEISKNEKSIEELTHKKSKVSQEKIDIDLKIGAFDEKITSEEHEILLLKRKISEHENKIEAIKKEKSEVKGKQMIMENYIAKMKDEISNKTLENALLILKIDDLKK